MSYIGTIRTKLELIHDMLPLTERELTLAIWAVEGNGEMELADDIAKQPKWWGEKAAKAYKVLQDEDFVDDGNIADNLLASLESTANFMRGMQLDPSMPFHAIDAIRERVALIDELTESVTMPDPKAAATLSESKGDSCP